MLKLNDATNYELENLLFGWRQTQILSVLFMIVAVLNLVFLLPGQAHLYFEFTIIISILYLVASIAMFCRQPWSVPLIVVMSIIACFNLPYGPVVGIFGLFTIRRALPYFVQQDLTFSKVNKVYSKRFEG